MKKLQIIALVAVTVLLVVACVLAAGCFMERNNPVIVEAVPWCGVWVGAYNTSETTTFAAILKLHMDETGDWQSSVIRPYVDTSSVLYLKLKWKPLDENLIEVTTLPQNTSYIYMYHPDTDTLTVYENTILNTFSRLSPDLEIRPDARSSFFAAPEEISEK